MKDVEEKHGVPLEELLPPLLSENGLIETSRYLGVNKSTLTYWLLKMRISTERIALAPGEEIIVTKKG